MTMSDPIADMLTRIRNANTAKHDTVDVPASKMKIAIADILVKKFYGNLRFFRLITTLDRESHSNLIVILYTI